MSDNTPIDDGVHDISDYKSVDQSPGFLSRLFSSSVMLWTLFVFTVVAGIYVLPVVFPEWGSRYTGDLDFLKQHSSVNRFARRTFKIDWKEALSLSNIKRELQVGTGLHPLFKKYPELKEKWFFSGKFFMMKTYVTDYEMATEKERAEWNKKDGLRLPATGIEHDEATQYCQALGARLPAPEELFEVFDLFQNIQAQGPLAVKLKPNLDLRFFESKALWTSECELDEGLFGWFAGCSDNFRIIVPGQDRDKFVYRDDGFDHEDLSFLCVKGVD